MLKCNRSENLKTRYRFQSKVTLFHRFDCAANRQNGASLSAVKYIKPSQLLLLLLFLPCILLLMFAAVGQQNLKWKMLFHFHSSLAAKWHPTWKVCERSRRRPARANKKRKLQGREPPKWKHTLLEQSSLGESFWQVGWWAKFFVVVESITLLRRRNATIMYLMLVSPYVKHRNVLQSFLYDVVFSPSFLRKISCIFPRAVLFDSVILCAKVLSFQSVSAYATWEVFFPPSV